MSSKNTTCDVLKRKRNVISLKIKLDILRRHGSGEKAFVIANIMGLLPTTIRSIIKSGIEIRASARATSSSSIENFSKLRPVIVQQIENALLMWTKDLCKKTYVFL